MLPPPPRCATRARLAEDLKQAAIEEGQWTEKRDFSATVGIGIIKTRLDAGRQRVAERKVARDAAAKAKSLNNKAVGQARPDDGDALALTFAQPVVPAEKEEPDEDEIFGRYTGSGSSGWMR